MSNRSAALLIGTCPELLRKIWSYFVNTGMVNHILHFSTVEELNESMGADVPSETFEIKLTFILIDSPEHLTLPVDLATHTSLSEVPIVAFFSDQHALTETDAQTLYERRVNSIVRLPLRFSDVGKLVLQFDKYWSTRQPAACNLVLPTENNFRPAQ